MPDRIFFDELSIKPTVNHYQIVKVRKRIVNDENRETVEENLYAFRDIREAMAFMAKELGASK